MILQTKKSTGKNFSTFGHREGEGGRFRNTKAKKYRCIRKKSLKRPQLQFSKFTTRQEFEITSHKSKDFSSKILKKKSHWFFSVLLTTTRLHINVQVCLVCNLTNKVQTITACLFFCWKFVTSDQPRPKIGIQSYPATNIWPSWSSTIDCRTFRTHCLLHFYMHLLYTGKWGNYFQFTSEHVYWCIKSKFPA